MCQACFMNKPIPMITQLTTNLSQLKKIEESHTNLVFGYYRQSHQKIFFDQSQDEPYYQIPSLIMYISLAYYYIKHEWDTENMNESCKIGDEAAADFVEQTISRFGTCLLKKQISNGIHEYKFKIIRFGKGLPFDIAIGIITTERFKLFTKGGEGGFNYSLDYVYVTSNGEKEGPDEFPHDYAWRCNVNDIITMTVDLDNHRLSFKVNDKDLGVAFNEIDKGKIWRVGVVFQNQGSKLQILQY